MLHFHHLIECNDQGLPTAAYVVWVYESQQGRRDFLALVALSVDRGYYFERVTQQSVEFVQRVIRAHQLPNEPKHIKARDYVRAVKQACRKQTNMPCSCAAHRQRKLLDDAYAQSCNIARAIIERRDNQQRKSDSLAESR